MSRSIATKGAPLMEMVGLPRAGLRQAVRGLRTKPFSYMLPRIFKISKYNFYNAKLVSFTVRLVFNLSYNYIYYKKTANNKFKYL